MPTNPRQPSHAQAVAAGDEIAGATLVEPMATGQRLSCWRANREDGSPATVHVLTQAANTRERKNFLEGARRLQKLSRSRPITGVMEIVAIEPMHLAYVGRGGAVGTMEDIKVLGWGTKEMVAFVRRVSRALGRLHAVDVFHGCLRPANVLIDEDLKPRLADVGMIVLDDSYDGPSDMKHDYAAYAAREIRLGEDPTSRSDVFSVGRLLYFALLGEEPDEQDEDVPLLRALKDQPPGLVRIVRRCTTRDPAERYSDMGALVADLANWEVAGEVGLKHPKGEEGVEGGDEEEQEASPAKRGVASASARPSESMRPAAPAEADEPKAPANVAITPVALREEQEEDILTPVQSRLGGLLGLAIIAGSLAVAYFTAAVSTIGVISLVVGVIGLSLAMPVIADAPVGSRITAAIVLGLAMFAADPLNEAAEAGRHAKLAEGSAEVRVTRLQQLVGRGFTNLGGIDYSGLSLEGMDLRGVSFAGARLTGTNLSRAKLAGASFDGADVAGANFAGADLAGAEMVKALGWTAARCDEDTVMPADWICEGGEPVPEEVSMPGVFVAPESE